MHTPTLGLPAAGDQKSAASQKPRSRGILHSLFCCVCRDDGDALPAHSGAPLLVEENGAVPKVRGGRVGAAGAAWAQPGGCLGKGAFHDPSAGLGRYGRGWSPPPGPPPSLSGPSQPVPECPKTATQGNSIRWELSLPWCSRWGSEVQSQAACPRLQLAGAKLGRGGSLPTVPVLPQVEGWEREDVLRRNDWVLREFKRSAPDDLICPCSRPQSSTCSQRPRPRTWTRSVWSSTWMRPWCTAPSR